MCMYGVRGCEIPGDYCVETVALYFVLWCVMMNVRLVLVVAIRKEWEWL